MPSGSGSGAVSECYVLTAKAAKLAGSGSLDGLSWVITEANLPSYMLDSDDPRSEASGAPTLKIYLDEALSSRVAIHVVDFSPTSGAVGATAEIWIDPGSYTGGSAFSVYLDWVPGGSDTQPAAGDPFGQYAVYDGWAFISHDGGLTDASGNFTPTNNGTVAGANPKIGQDCREFDGSNDDINISDTTDPTEYTIMSWVRPDDSTLRNIFVRTNSSGPSSAWSHQLRFTSGGFAEHYTFDEGAVLTRSVIGTTAISTGAYVHVCGTAKNGDNIRLFVDGAEEGTPASLTTLWTSGDRYRIGDATGNSMAHLDGQTDTTGYILSELDPGQIQTLFNNQDDPGDFWVGSACSAGSGSGAVGSGSGFIDEECYDTIARDTTFNRAVIWSPYTGAVVDLAGAHAIANATPRDQGNYWQGSASSRLSRSRAMAMKVIKDDLATAIKKMAAHQCSVHAALFGFVRHDLFLVDSKVNTSDEREPGGRMAGTFMDISQMRKDGAMAQVTNILEFAPWYATQASLVQAGTPGAGSGSGFTSGTSGTYELLGRKETSFNGATWQVDEGMSVDALGTMSAGTAILEFTFPMATMVLDLVGNWAGTLAQLDWDGNVIESTSKTYGVDAQATLDTYVWSLRITVTEADEMPRITVFNAGTSQGVREGACADCSQEDARATSLPAWMQLLADTMWLLVNDNGTQRVQSAAIDAENDPWPVTTRFSTFTNQPRLACVDQAAGKIYILEHESAGTHFIRRYNLDGTGVETLVTNTDQDITDFKIFRRSQRILVLLNRFNLPSTVRDAMQIYDYDGTLLDEIDLTNQTLVGNMGIDGRNGISSADAYYQASGNEFRVVDLGTRVETLLPDISGNWTVLRNSDADASAGYYFFIGTSGQIKRVPIPSAASTEVVATVSSPSGLVLDKGRRLLYWGQLTAVIESDYAGDDPPRTVISHASSLAVLSMDFGVDL